MFKLNRFGRAVGVAFLTFGATAWAAPIPISHNYTEIQAFMMGLATQYPANVQMFDLGRNDQGSMIQGLKIGSGSIHNLVVGTHHGNEHGSTEVAKAFAASVAANPIQGQTMFVIPVLNITGYNANSRRESLGASTIDPNRDYPGPCGTEGPYHLKSTKLLADFVASQGIVALATLHTFSPAVVYPWGISSHDLDTPYTSLWQQLVQAATQESQYPTGNSTEVVYPADGCFEDWAFWKQGAWAILFELGTTHSPSSTQVADMQAKNVPGLRRMFEIAPHERADRHDFTGRCDASLKSLDRHNE